MSTDAALNAHVAADPANQASESPDAAMDAVANDLGALFGDEPAAKEPVRGEDGKFKKAEDGKEPAKDAKAADAEPADAETDYFEVEEPGEDGKPVAKRYKADEVWTGFQRAKELEGEVAKLRERPALAPEAETLIADTVKQRAAYIGALQQWQQFNQPQQPDADKFLNPQSPHYDPDAYYRQMQQYRDTTAQRERVAAELQQQQQAQTEQERLLHSAFVSREQAALLKAVPEFKDRAFAKTFAEGLEKHFGVGRDVLENMFDHRFYVIAKAALDQVQGKAKAQEAAKIVRAKPKVVRGQARGNQSPSEARSEAAMARLQKSGSIDDAFDGIAALLN